ncbi:MAG: DUF4390 domain-containing protein [Candidatus Poribacteria bacterium]
MKKLVLSFKLLYRITVIGILCIFANTAEVSSAENTVRIIQNCILKGNLAMKFQADDIFDQKVMKFLNRGFTVRVEYNIELWQKRGYWFDSLRSQRSISYQINYDPIEKIYQCQRFQNGLKVTTKSDKQIDNLARWIVSPDLYLVFGPIDQLSLNDRYYYNIEVLVATLTAENVRDLRKWLGDFGEQGEQSSSFSKTAVNMIIDFLSSRNHKRFSTRSEQFYISALPKIER